MNPYIKLLRTEQYIKNLFVFAPLFFGKYFLDIDAFKIVIAVFICFAIAASSIYILNDYFDVNEDRLHPEKCKRPIAAGTVKTAAALILMFFLMLISLSVSLFISQQLFSIILGYIFLNVLYSKWLKHIAILDINIIAIGFVLRLLAGAVVLPINPSVWLLLITYLLALFLGIGKRRTDVVLSQNGMEVRKNIEGYNLVFIDTILAVLASIIIVCYIFYCNSPEILRNYHSNLIYISIIFVANGIFRYLKLAIVDQSTYSPTIIVLKDRFVQITILLWLLLMSYLLYFNS
jgi:decaprenyl-phosphate phosphoribosyltransferase